MRVMVKALRILGLLVVVGALQTVLTDTWMPLGLLDPLMVATGLLALRLPFVPAVFTGAAAGLVQDSLSGGLLGLHAFAKTAVAAALTSLGQFLVVRGELASAIVIGLGALAEGLIVKLLLLLLSWPGGEALPWTVGRAAGTAFLTAAFLLGLPRVVMSWKRWRQRPRLRFR